MSLILTLDSVTVAGALKTKDDVKWKCQVSLDSCQNLSFSSGHSSEFSVEREHNLTFSCPRSIVCRSRTEVSHKEVLREVIIQGLLESGSHRTVQVLFNSSTLYHMGKPQRS